jgi:hypothetical protein
VPVVQRDEAAFAAQLESERNANREVAGPGASSSRRDEKAGKRKSGVTKTRVKFKGEASEEAVDGVVGSTRPRAAGRSSIPLSVFIVIEQKNPKSDESKSRYEKYKAAKTLTNFTTSAARFTI